MKPFFLATGPALCLGLILCSPSAHPQGKPIPKVIPKLEPLAETKLLMEGLAHANFRGLERKLTVRPTEDTDWIFARGQALLIGETANLLMLRPPKKEGQETWFLRSIDLRNRATALATNLAAKNYEMSRRGLIDLSTSCNNCHKSFRVPVLIEAFETPLMKVE